MEHQAEQYGNKEWKRELPGNPFMEHNFVRPAGASDGKAVCVLTARPESLNVYGYIHGGAIYTLADNAAGYAAHTDGRAYVTQNGNLYFVGNQRGGTLTATAQVRHRGRQTCLTDVAITGENGKLIATGSFEYFCVRQTVQEPPENVPVPPPETVPPENIPEP